MCLFKKKPTPVVPTPGPTNRGPIAYEPFTTALAFSAGARIDLDLRYREHGCNAAGKATGVTGAWDPDGDKLEYAFDCPWTVFDQARNPIPNGHWIQFPLDDRGEQKALVTVFIGHTESNPPYPFGPKGCGAFEPGGKLVFTYHVRDGKGGEASKRVEWGS